MSRSMKRIIANILLVVFATVFWTACDSEKGEEQGEYRKEFSARFVESLGTKSEVGQVIGRSWIGEEHIHVFKGSTSLGDFVSAEDGERKTAVFKSVGSGEILDVTDGDYWAVYPYNPDDKCDGASVTMAVPAIQEAHEKGVFLRSFPAVAHSQDGESFDFYNVCGGIRFTVACEGIESVAFRTWSNTSLAGSINVRFGEDGLPSVLIDDHGDNKDYVFIKAPSGSFIPGVEYFAAFLPVNLPFGIYAVLKKGDKEAYLQLDDFVSSNRSVIVSMEEIDKDLVFGDPILGDDLYAEFAASFAEPFTTEDGQVVNRNWIGEESIAVFQGPFTVGEYRSSETGQRETAQFRRVGPKVNNVDGRTFFMAVYPYSKDYGSSLGYVSLTVPSEQPALDESETMRSMPAVAVSDGRRFSFSNLCGAIRFSLNNSGINSVTFTSSKGEPISGVVHLDYSDMTVASGPNLDYVKVSASGEGFVPGKAYMAYFLPQSFASGMDVVLTMGEKQVKWPLDIKSVKKSIITNTFVLDEGVDFDNPGPDPDETIVFADGRMKAQCVAAFDKNNDGELSVGEAAAVTSIENVFTDNQCSSFDEFRYFVSVKEIPASCFNGWANLESISLPEGVRLIGGRAFYACTKLTRINILSIEAWLKIAYGFTTPFGRYLNFYDGGMPFAASKDGHLYVDGEEITVIDIPSSCKSIGDFAFLNCKGVTRIVFHPGDVSIGSYAFNGCDKLSWVDVPSVKDWLSIYNYSFFSTSVSAGLFTDVTYRPAHLLIAGEEVTDIVVPEGVITIPDFVFSHMSSIVSVSIPSSVTKLGDSSFAATQLEKLILKPETPPTLSYSTSLQGVTCPIYVPAQSVDLYKATWRGNASQIEAIED